VIYEASSVRENYVDVLENPLFFEKLFLIVSSISLIVVLLGEETGDSLSGM